MAFGARDRETVDDFHRAATDAGYASSGAPAERSQQRGCYTAGVLDPDGANLESVCRGHR
jgi:predicted lactoylglutathione lyase